MRDGSDRILREVSEEFHVPVRQIVGRRKLAHLVEVRVEVVKRLRKAGYTIHEIAEVLEREPLTIAMLSRRTGLPRIKFHISNEQIAEMFRLRADGASYSQITSATGIPASSINRLLKQYATAELALASRQKSTYC